MSLVISDLLIDLYYACVCQKVKPDFIDKVQAFSEAFHDCFWQFGLQETVKVHIMLAHSLDFVMATGRTMARWSDEAIERCHSVSRRVDELHHTNNNLSSMELFNARTQSRATRS